MRFIELKFREGSMRFTELKFSKGDNDDEVIVVRVIKKEIMEWIDQNTRGAYDHYRSIAYLAQKDTDEITFELPDDAVNFKLAWH